MASLVPAVWDTVITGNKFSEKTSTISAPRYIRTASGRSSRFGVRTDSTPEAGDSLPYNSAQIKGLVFDTWSTR